MVETKPQPIGELFEQHQEELLDFLTRRVGRTDAQDLLQEAFARMLRSGEPRPLASPFYFLRKVAINLVRDQSRRRAFESSWLSFPGGELDAPAQDVSPLQRLEREERARLFRAAVAGLPPRCRPAAARCSCCASFRKCRSRRSRGSSESRME